MKLYDAKDRVLSPEPYILGIESSCDDTACAITKGRKVLSEAIISSAEIMELYGGVVPEIASRAHTDAVSEVTGRALKEAGITIDKIDAVAVTYGAGLLGSLLVGLSFAKALAYSLDVPLICVNHIRGHIASAYLECDELEPPFVTLLASGGHTAILYTKDTKHFECLASTCDDAAGEAFDKIARVLGLPYPGGPNIQRAAKDGKACISFPSCETRDKTRVRFSYSGLKTYVLNYVNSKKMKGEEINIGDVAASFQVCAIEPLVKRTIEYAQDLGVRYVTLGGGVAANDYLRARMEEECKKHDLWLILPEKRRCTDNAAMICAEGYVKYTAGDFSPMSQNAEAQIPLESVLKT